MGPPLGTSPTKGQFPRQSPGSSFGTVRAPGQRRFLPESALDPTGPDSGERARLVLMETEQPRSRRSYLGIDAMPPASSSRERVGEPLSKGLEIIRVRVHGRRTASLNVSVEVATTHEDAAMNAHTGKRAAANQTAMQPSPERRVRLVDPVVTALAELGSNHLQRYRPDERGQCLDVQYRLHGS
jgi:hypothetical protein